MFRFWKVGVLFVVAIIGCGDSGPALVPITGTLTLDGEPLPFKSLTLLPTDGTSGQGAGGYSDGQGSYTMLAVVPGAIKDFKGCPPGRYRVVVSEPLIPMTDADFENGAAGTADGSEPAVAVFLPDSAPRKNVKGGIPNIYTSDKTSPLIIDVAEGNEQIDIELDSTAK